MTSNLVCREPAYTKLDLHSQKEPISSLLLGSFVLTLNKGTGGSIQRQWLTAFPAFGILKHFSWDRNPSSLLPLSSHPSHSSLFSLPPSSLLPRLFKLLSLSYIFIPAQAHWYLNRHLADRDIIRGWSNLWIVSFPCHLSFNYLLTIHDIPFNICLFFSPFINWNHCPYSTWTFLALSSHLTHDKRLQFLASLQHIQSQISNQTRSLVDKS